MPKNYVEYGAISPKQLADDYTERSILSCLVVAIGCISLYAGSIIDSVITFSMLPLVWLRELSSYCSSNDSDSFKERINELAEQLTPLPSADLSDYDAKDYPDLDDPETLRDLLDYLDDVLHGCGWTRAVEALKEVDPRLELVIVNKAYAHNSKVEIPVYIRDAGWTGEPTANTMIIGIETTF